MMLIAVRPVLYLAHQYAAGDELPVNNPGMVEAWIEAGSAQWQTEEPDTYSTAPTAVPAAAPAGRPGISDSGIDGELIGRIPETPERKKATAKKGKRT